MKEEVSLRMLNSISEEVKEKIKDLSIEDGKFLLSALNES